MKLARLAAAAAIPVLTIIGLAGSASAAGSVVVTPGNPIPAVGAPQATVVGSGFTPGDQLFMSQCVDAPRQAGATFNPATDCEAFYATATIDVVDAAGNFTDNFDIYTGVVRAKTAGGVGFTCDSANPCRIRISVGTFAATAGQVFSPLTFAAGVTPTTTTTVAATTTTLPVTPPVVPESPLPIMLPIGAAAVLGAGYMMLRKGRNSSVNA